MPPIWSPRLLLSYHSVCPSSQVTQASLSQLPPDLHPSRREQRYTPAHQPPCPSLGAQVQPPAASVNPTLPAPGRKERQRRDRNLPVSLAPLSQQSKEGWPDKRTFGANLTPADQGGCPLHATQTQKAACVLTPCGHSCLRPEQDQRSEPNGHQHQHPPGTGTGEPRTSAQSLEEPAELPSDQGERE